MLYVPLPYLCSPMPVEAVEMKKKKKEKNTYIAIAHIIECDSNGKLSY